MMRKKELSVIIPAYNETKRIAPTIESMRKYFKYKKYNYEIIVVDDGSTDDTADVVQTFVGKDKNIFLKSYGENKGKGFAVNYGVSFATGDYIMYADADGAISIDHLDIFLKYIKKGYDIVIGSIELPGHTAIDNNQWYRRILGHIGKLLIRFTATPGIYDTQRAFKLFTRDAAGQIFPRQTIARWGFDIELLVIARKHSCKIKELPVCWINPGGSRVTGLSVYVRTLSELAEIVMKSLLGFYRPSSFWIWREKRGGVSTASNY